VRNLLFQFLILLIKVEKNALTKFREIMNSYFDTSVIFAALTHNHKLHEVASKTLAEAAQQGEITSTTLHTYAELYNNLTRPNPAKTELKPADAYKLLVDILGKKLTLVELDRSDYEAALKRCADLNLVRGIIYDALHVQAALKSGADILYTDNLRDFNRLVTEEDDLVVKGVR
jgi:predicted nucleic acid-binding protein